MLKKGETAGVPGAFVVIAAFQLTGEWGNLSPDFHAQAGHELLQLLSSSERSVDIDVYIASGLKAATDYFLRVRAHDLAQAQLFLEDLARTRIGRFSNAAASLVGMTKSRLYITPEKSAELNEQLNATPYTGEATRFAIVIPVKKDACWWGMREEERRREIEIHTRKSMPYLASIKRELYHSTGIDDLDFITYFETADLAAFHELAVTLSGITENEFHTRWGQPTLLGTIQSIPDAVARLCRQL
jgi:chlorite dismutase